MAWAMDDHYWLPRNITWDDMPTRWGDMLYAPLFVALPMAAFRVLLEGLVGIPVGAAMGYGDAGQLKQRVLDHIQGGFARNSRTKRRLECFWRMCFYTFAFWYGCWILSDKPWLYDVRECWIDYPHHPPTNDLWWYYTIEIGFYYSLLFSLILDRKRYDFWALFIHHVVTIALLTASWGINFVRVGSLVQISHDISEMFLEMGKLARYDGELVTLTNLGFGLFFGSWIVSRLIYFPFVLLRSCLYDAPSYLQPGWQLFDLSEKPYAPRFIIYLLFILLVLHIFWTYVITKVLMKMFTSGQASDVRTDSEAESDEVEEADAQKERLKKLTKRARKDQ